jgi:hypothetical protein
VLVDLTQDLVFGIELDAGDGVIRIVPVHYLKLPQYCPAFHQKGYLPVTCPRVPHLVSTKGASPDVAMEDLRSGASTSQAGQEQNLESGAQEMDFIEVRKRKSISPSKVHSLPPGSQL